MSQPAYRVVRVKKVTISIFPIFLAMRDQEGGFALDKNVSKVKNGDKVILGWIKGNGIQAEGAKFFSGDEIINSGPVTTF